jgi:hypothetical protein
MTSSKVRQLRIDTSRTGNYFSTGHHFEPAMTSSSRLKAADWVQVRTKDEILKTLDGRGQLEALPFMPEMFDFCGRRFKVLKRAHKTCDPPNGIHGRSMPRAVHLEGVRCNGAAHGGCQHGCLIFWKDEWLKKLDDPNEAGGSDSDLGHLEAVQETACAEADVWAGVVANDRPLDSDGPRYVCQSTQVALATRPLRWWDARQYLEDCTSRNVHPTELLVSFVFFLLHQLASAGIGLGSPVRWLYDAVQRIRGGTPYPFRTGMLPKGVKTPSAPLDLQPGELVRVRSYQEILGTISETGHNRGMWFGEEMVPFCGRTYRVLNRVNRIIDEKTGKMLVLKNECIALDGVTCEAHYSTYRRFCPRAIQQFWREIWLERVVQHQPETTHRVSPTSDHACPADLPLAAFCQAKMPSAPPATQNTVNTALVPPNCLDDAA